MWLLLNILSNSTNTMDKLLVLCNVLLLDAYSISWKQYRLQNLFVLKLVSKHFFHLRAWAKQSFVKWSLHTTDHGMLTKTPLSFALLRSFVKLRILWELENSHGIAKIPWPSSSNALRRLDGMKYRIIWEKLSFTSILQSHCLHADNKTRQ